MHLRFRERIDWGILVCALGWLALGLGCRKSADSTSNASAVDSTANSSQAIVNPAANSGSDTAGKEIIPPLAADSLRTVPSWIADAVFYQIFPERFRNGDPTNDPTHDSLEFADKVPESWTITPWTSDWYSRADWEKETGDSFYDNGVFNRRYGGDLQGVLDKLGYLEDLGINVIYFNPVFYARSLHKYDGVSMHHIDPYFGPDPGGDLAMLRSETSDPDTWQWTAADKLFLELLRQAHQRGIRVIIDGVFNHTGLDFFAFADLVKNQQQSPYKQWYIIQRFDDPATPQNDFTYKGWWGVDTLPEFSDAPGGKDLHDGPKQYVFDITRRWMDPNGDGNPADGIDGWRLDVANEVPVKFWYDWNQLVRQLNPEAYTVAEVWGSAREFLTAGRFSATMNYHGFAYPVKGFLIDGRLTPHDFGLQLATRQKEYPPEMQLALQNLIDSHDTDRVASMIVNTGKQPYAQPDRFDYDVSERVSPRHTDRYRVQRPSAEQRRIQRMVALMQMTYVGAPMVYYGTEAGMWGADDPCDRQPMVWGDLQYDDQTSDPLGRERTPDKIGFREPLYQFYRAAIELRHRMPALRRGTFQPIASDDAAMFFAFRRKLDKETLYVAINRGEDSCTWRPPVDEQHSIEQIFCASGEPDKIEIQRDNDGVMVLLPALEAAVFIQRSRLEK